MFFDGGLQAGISLALKDEKPIVCFVKGHYWNLHLDLNKLAYTIQTSDDSEKSLYWEDNLLKNDEVVSI